MDKTHLLIFLQLLIFASKIWASTAPSFAPNTNTLTKEAPALAPPSQEKAGPVPIEKPDGIDRSSNGHNMPRTEWNIKPSNVIFEFSSPLSPLGKSTRDISNNNNNPIRQSAQNTFQPYNHAPQFDKSPNPTGTNNNYVSLNPSMQPPPPYLPPPQQQQQQPRRPENNFEQQQQQQPRRPENNFEQQQARRPENNFEQQQARRPENNFEQQPPTTFSRPMQMPALQMFLRPPPQNQAQNPNSAQFQPEQFPQAQQQQQQWVGIPKNPSQNYFTSTTSSTSASLLPAPVGPTPTPYQPQPQPQSQSPQMSYHSNQIDTDPEREIMFLIHKPGDESIIQNTISEDSKRTGQTVEFIKGPNLKLTQQQKVYLPPKPKTIVYIMLTEPQVETNVQVMGQGLDGVDNEQGPEPEVYVVYQRSNSERKTLHHGHEELGHGHGGYSSGSGHNRSTISDSGPSEFSIPILPKSTTNQHDDFYQTSSSNQNHVVNHQVNIFGKSFQKEYGIGIGGVQKLNLVNSAKHNSISMPDGHRNSSSRAYNSNSVNPTAATATAEVPTTKRQLELLPMCKTV